MGRTPWLDAERATWLAEAEEWVTASCGSVGPLESVKERPWGAVLRATTPAGSLYFKAAGPLGRHEPVVVSDLAPRWPSLVPQVLSVDLDRAWMLLADHGIAMRDILSPPDQVTVLERLLPMYAEMQAATSTEVHRWLASGAPDRRVDRLPDLLQQLLDGSSPIGLAQIDDADRATYLADLPLLTAVCEELAATPMAQAIDHADIHGTNVLTDGPSHRLIDWGDSCITHAFSSLFVPLQLVVTALPGSEQRAATLRLRDAYLEPWGATREHRRVLGLAGWVAAVTRAVAVAHETLGEPDDHAEIADLLRGWHRRRSLLDRPDDVLQPS